MIGMMTSPTSELTMAPKAAPMITPTARSTTLPRRANFLKSSIMDCPFLKGSRMALAACADPLSSPRLRQSYAHISRLPVDRDEKEESFQRLVGDRKHTASKTGV